MDPSNSQLQSQPTPRTRAEWSALIARDRELAAQRRIEARAREVERRNNNNNNQRNPQ